MYYYLIHLILHILIILLFFFFSLNKNLRQHKSLVFKVAFLTELKVEERNW